MILPILLTLLTFMGLGLTAPTIHEANLATTFPRSSATNCDECHEHRDLCLKYAVGGRGSGEPQVCTSYVCRRFDCTSCRGEFSCDDANLTMPPGW